MAATALEIWIRLGPKCYLQCNLVHVYSEVSLSSMDLLPDVCIGLQKILTLKSNFLLQFSYIVGLATNADFLSNSFLNRSFSSA